jgi:ABC-type sugar transport system ATPase subunit
MIEVKGIQKSFGADPVLREVGFTLPAQQNLAILGKSGCGKTTLLKIMAGLESATQGSFRIEGREMLGLKPQDRGVVYLSQEPLLFPHLDVYENIAFGLRLRKLAARPLGQQVEAMLDSLGLTAQGRKRPEALSGGQKQRVAFGRAVIIRPKVLLLDEPFGSLDSETRAEMQQFYNGLRKQEQITSLFVTHDLREAIVMGDRLARMAEGRLELYADQAAFLQSADSGMANELAFWREILLPNASNA